MMVLLLLPSALLTLAAAGPAPPQFLNSCTIATYGSLLGLPLKFSAIPLKSGVEESKFTIPTDVCPPLMRAVGAVVNACDPDGPPPPAVQLTALGSAQVVRRTSLKSPALAVCILFCGLATETIDEDADSSEEAGDTSDEVTDSSEEVDDTGDVAADTSDEAATSPRPSDDAVRRRFYTDNDRFV